MLALSQSLRGVLKSLVYVSAANTCLGGVFSASAQVMPASSEPVSGWADYALTYGYSSLDGLNGDLFDDQSRDGVGSRIGLGVAFAGLDTSGTQLVLGVDAASTFEAFPSAWAGDETNLDDLEISAFNVNAAWFLSDATALTAGFSRSVLGGQVQLASGAPVVRNAMGAALPTDAQVRLSQSLTGYRIGFQYGNAVLSPDGRVVAPTNTAATPYNRLGGVAAVRFETGYGRLEEFGLAESVSTAGEFVTERTRSTDGLLLGFRAGGETGEINRSGWSVYGNGGGDLLIGSRGYAVLSAEGGGVYRYDAFEFRAFVAGTVSLESIYASSNADGATFAAEFGGYELLVGASIGLRF